MSNKFVTRWFIAPLGKYIQESGALFFKKSEEKSTQRFVDCDAYANSLNLIYNDLDALGYDVVSVVPIATGQSENCYQSNDNYVGDVGFSITRGAVVVGKRRN